MNSRNCAFSTFLVFEDACGSSDAVVDTEERRGLEAVFHEDVVTEAVERLDRRVREFTHPVVTVGDDSLSHLRRRVVGERHEEDVLGLTSSWSTISAYRRVTVNVFPVPPPGVDDVDALFAVDELFAVGRSVSSSGSLLEDTVAIVHVPVVRLFSESRDREAFVACPPSVQLFEAFPGRIPRKASISSVK